MEVYVYIILVYVLIHLVITMKHDDLESKNTSLEVPIQVEWDLEVDPDGKFEVVSYIYLQDGDEGTEVRGDFDAIVEDLIVYYAESMSSSDGYGQLYCIAHELHRHGERLRTVAAQIEDAYAGFLDGDEDDLI